MADVGMLIPEVGGMLKPYLIRTETTIPEITPALRVGPAPTATVVRHLQSTVSRTKSMTAEQFRGQ